MITAVSDTELLTAVDVAEILDVAPQTVRRWIVGGRLRAVRLGPSPRARYRVTRSALDAFVVPARGIGDVDRPL